MGKLRKNIEYGENILILLKILLKILFKKKYYWKCEYGKYIKIVECWKL